MYCVARQVELFRRWASARRSLEWLKPSWRFLKGNNWYKHVKRRRTELRNAIRYLTRTLSITEKSLADRIRLLASTLVDLIVLIGGPSLMSVWLRHRCTRRIPESAPGTDDPLVVILNCSQLSPANSVKEEALALVDAGFRVKVLCPEWEPATSPPTWDAGVEIHVVPRALGVRWEESPWEHGLPLLESALNERPWAYLAHGDEAILPALVAAADRRVPCVSSFHHAHLTSDDKRGADNRPSFFQRHVRRLVQRLFRHSASHVVAENDEVAQLLAQQYRLTRPPYVGKVAEVLMNLSTDRVTNQVLERHGGVDLDLPGDNPELQSEHSMVMTKSTTIVGTRVLQQVG